MAGDVEGDPCKCREMASRAPSDVRHLFLGPNEEEEERQRSPGIQYSFRPSGKITRLNSISHNPREVGLYF